MNENPFQPPQQPRAASSGEVRRTLSRRASGLRTWVGVLLYVCALFAGLSATAFSGTMVLVAVYAKNRPYDGYYLEGEVAAVLCASPMPVIDLDEGELRPPAPKPLQLRIPRRCTPL